MIKVMVGDDRSTILTQMCAASPTPQDHAKETSPVGSTMLRQACADSLYMEGAGVMIIGSREKSFVNSVVSFPRNKVRNSFTLSVPGFAFLMI